MKNITIILFFLIVIKSFSQDLIKEEIGVNVSSLFGKTIELRGIYMSNKNYSFTSSACYMLNNKLPISYAKIGDFTSDNMSMGPSVGIGVRYTPRTSIKKNHFFIGVNLISGYFIQSAIPDNNFEQHFIDGIIPDDYYFDNGRVYSQGIYIGISGEIGGHFEFFDFIGLDVGIEIGFSLYETKRQVSEYHNRLPGIGVMHIKGLLCPYQILKKNK